jgi:hypothetical protein
VRPELVILPPVVAHDYPRFRQRPQLFPVQALHRARKLSPVTFTGVQRINC